MTRLYGARGVISLSNITYQVGRFYFPGFRKTPDIQILSRAQFATNAGPEKGWARKLVEGLSQKNDFRKSNYNSAESTEFLPRSILSSSVNFGPLMTNEDALESWHQGELFFGHLAGVRGAYKNKLAVHGKRALESWHQGELVFGHPAGVRGTHKNKLSVQGIQWVLTKC